MNRLKFSAGLALAPIIALADPFIVNFDEGGFGSGWTRAEGLLSDLVFDATAGIGGSGGMLHSDAVNPDEPVIYIYDQSIGGFAFGTVSVKFFWQKQDSSGNVPIFVGFTTEPGVAPVLFSETLEDPDFLGVMLRDSATPTRFRCEIIATVSNGGTAGGRIVMGQGFPETFVDFVDNTWYELRMTIVDEGEGKWNLLASLSLLNSDGTEVVDEFFKVNDYNDIQSRADGSPLHPPLDGLTEFTQATEIYPFIGVRGGNKAGMRAFDELIFDLGGANTDLWNGYEVDENGWVNAVDWIGLVNVENDPWVYSLDLGKYIYVNGDTGWVFVPR